MRLTKRGNTHCERSSSAGRPKDGEEVVSVLTIAYAEKLSFKFLENILAALKPLGYVASKRGKMGRVMLAKSAKEIHFGDSVSPFDEWSALIGCAGQTDCEKCSCLDETHEVLGTMGSNGLHTLTGCVLPDSLSFVVSGMKQGWAFAWPSLMAAEIYVTMLSGYCMGHLRSGTAKEERLSY